MTATGHFLMSLDTAGQKRWLAINREVPAADNVGPGPASPTITGAAATAKWFRSHVSGVTGSSNNPSIISGTPGRHRE